MSVSAVFSPSKEIDRLAQAVEPLSSTGAAIAPVVGVAIVSYNSFEDIKRCLKSLAAQTFQKFHVVIVDNLSPDRSGPALNELTDRYPFPVYVVLNPENRGFAAGTNIGIRNCLTLGADLIWLLNPDTECRPGALAALVRCAADYPAAAAFGSKVIYGGQTEGDGDRLWGAGGTVDNRRGIAAMRGCGEFDTGQFDTIEPCGYLPGCSMIIRRSAVQEIGYLPEEYFLYFEETDWCATAGQMGYPLLYVPQSVVLHHVLDEKMQRPLVVFFYNRNERRFWMKFGDAALRRRILKNLIFHSLPAALRGYWAAPNSDSRAVFRAHLLSLVDFFMPGIGQKLLLRRI